MDAKIWLLAGGVGLFLTGMYLMETALAHLAGRDFKLLLRRNTNRNGRALVSGIVTTALLQSSSVVSFLTLAFVGSGLIRMVNALAVVLGANIGTTLSNWIIVTVGFTLNLDIVWYLLLGVAGSLLPVLRVNQRWQQLLYFLIGLSFLFIALDLMTEGMQSTVSRFDFNAYRSLPPVVFVLIGLVLTFFIQSSNATMVITLSALYAGIIPFPLAASVVIGSELGTSLKLVLATAGGSASKKQLAAGNILLNLFTTVLAFVFLDQAIWFVRSFIGIKDPLHALVAFQMTINLASALLFFPFLHPIARWLERRFTAQQDRSSLYIDAAVPALPAFAQEIFRLETFYFLKRVMGYHAAEFQVSSADAGLDMLLTGKEKERDSGYHQIEERYAQIKKSHGELIEYYVAMQKTSGSSTELAHMNQLMKSVHSAMYAAKGFKDINHNKEELLQSGNDVKYGQFSGISTVVRKNLSTLSAVLMMTEAPVAKEAMSKLLEDIQHHYKHMLSVIYATAGADAMPEKDISTLQNMNRELYSSFKSLVYAAADFLLPPADAETIRNLPLTIR
jgi:phosphate:Na+ symporter